MKKHGRRKKEHTSTGGLILFAFLALGVGPGIGFCERIALTAFNRGFSWPAVFALAVTVTVAALIGVLTKQPRAVLLKLTGVLVLFFSQLVFFGFAMQVSADNGPLSNDPASPLGRADVALNDMLDAVLISLPWIMSLYAVAVAIHAWGRRRDVGSPNPNAALNQQAKR